ncbi:MAG: nitroreductase family protein, partial [Actinomycetales bacterium]
MTSTSIAPYVLSDETLDLLFREARTANSFTDEPVSVEQVRDIFELTKFGPTAMNNQP